jgi:DNA-binding transcriptional regulator LsrR (DeoR family)
MPTPRDPATLVAAARLYYLQGRSQAEVAAQLQTSRSNVSRMLTEAQRQGIVEIRINDPAGRQHELEDELRTLFGLRDVRVAHGRIGAGMRVEDQVGAQAARLLLDNLKDSMTVALSWGTALQSMVYATTSDQAFHGLTLCQLVGGLSSVRNEISGQDLVRELAVRLDADYRFLHAPAALESATARDALLAETSISDALRHAARADLAIVGIGTPSHGSSEAVWQSLGLDRAEQAAFWASGPVGDVAARYFTAAGQPVHGAVEDRVLALPLSDLVAIPHVIGVASGRAKTPGVLGALRGRLVDSLVCDESLARSVLSAAQHPTDTTTEPGSDR